MRGEKCNLNFVLKVKTLTLDKSFCFVAIEIKEFIGKKNDLIQSFLFIGQYCFLFCLKLISQVAASLHKLFISHIVKSSRNHIEVLEFCQAKLWSEQVRRSDWGLTVPGRNPLCPDREHQPIAAENWGAQPIAGRTHSLTDFPLIISPSRDKSRMEIIILIRSSILNSTSMYVDCLYWILMKNS